MTIHSSGQTISNLSFIKAIIQDECEIYMRLLSGFG